jgi:hypothetical protein
MWFQLLQRTLAKYGIAKEDIWNFDETGFMMGVISATGMVVTRAERRGGAKMAQQGNREWVTVIQGVSSQGWAIPPFIIVAGKYHLSSWYQDSPLPEDWIIAVSEKGWTTNERGLEWIRHFDKHSRGRATGAYRLLVLDGHESHHSTEFELYCKENKIITLCMPAHSSHILQPLDVGCFAALEGMAVLSGRAIQCDRQKVCITGEVRRSLIVYVSHLHDHQDHQDQQSRPLVQRHP